jgi:hypothetical protein
MRTFRSELDRYLLGAPGGRDDAALRAIFTSWRDNHAGLEPILTASELGQEARPLSRDLSTLGRIGLEALDSIRGGAPAPADWATRARETVMAAAPARAELEIAVVPGVAKLVLAAAQLDRLKTMTPAEWSKRLDEQLRPAAPSEEP